MPTLRCDIIDVYIFRRGAGAEFLQLLRAADSKHMPATWHPVMGHVEAGETAVACAVRELDEEVGLREGDPAWLGLWALEEVHPFFLTASDEVVLSPRFAAEVATGWRPRLNREHTSFRWVAAGDVDQTFMWPGQRAAIAEIVQSLLREGSAATAALRVR
jgi:8-oxo-dGTP pyrophosphatase MutT (NUDIX family)